MAEPTISFDANAVAVLALFVAKNDIRFYLHGLCVIPAPHGAGCILAATNGHQLALWHDAAGMCDEQTILTIGKPLIEACSERGTSARKVKYADDRLTLIDAEGGEVFIQPEGAKIEANYPNIWRVIPTNDKLTPGLHGCMATRYLRTIGKAAKIIYRNSACAMTASHYSVGTDGNGGILTRFEGAHHFMVITMPVSGQSPYPDPSPRPACFAPPVRPAVEATANFPSGSMGEEVITE